MNIKYKNKLQILKSSEVVDILYNDEVFIKIPKEYKFHINNQKILNYIEEIKNRERFLSIDPVTPKILSLEEFKKKYTYKCYAFLIGSKDVFSDNQFEPDKGDSSLRCGVCGYPYFYNPWFSLYKSYTNNEIVYQVERMDEYVRCRVCGTPIKNNSYIIRYK